MKTWSQLFKRKQSNPMSLSQWLIIALAWKSMNVICDINHISPNRLTGWYCLFPPWLNFLLLPIVQIKPINKLSVTFFICGKKIYTMIAILIFSFPARLQSFLLDWVWVCHSKHFTSREAYFHVQKWLQFPPSFHISRILDWSYFWPR